MSRLCPALVAVAAFVTFLPVWGNDFVNWDDPFYFTWNQNYRGLSFANISWMFTTLDFSHYQPLTWLTHGFVYVWWGMDPRAYHFGNLLLHVANAVVFYFLLLQLLALRPHPPTRGVSSATRAAAMVGALFFAVHPLRVEAVAWATERQGLLSAFFWLLAVLAYLRRATPGFDDRSRRRWYVLSLACFVLSLLAKAVGMMLPIVLLVLDVYPLRRFAAADRRARRAARGWIAIEKVPYVLASVAAGVLALHAKQARNLPTLAEHGLPERIMQSMYGLCFYIWKTVLPTNLSPVYLLERPLDPTDWRYVACAAAVIVVSAALVRLYRRWPWALVAWLCYALILFPVLGITQSGVQKVADRYTYLGCLPWAAVLAGAMQWAWRSPARLRSPAIAGSGAAVLIVLTALGVMASVQTRVWRDSLSMWGRVIDVEPGNYIAYNYRGTARRLKNDLLGARADFDAALRLRASYWDAQVNRAWARRATGDLDGAIEDYTELIRQSPRYAFGFNGRARCREAKGDLDRAIADYGNAVAYAAAGSSERSEFERNLNTARRQLAAQSPRP